jgi:hypothetical protein
MADKVPGHTCQATKPVNVRDGGTAISPTPACGPTGGSVWRSDARVMHGLSPHPPEMLAPEFGACYAPVVTSLCLNPIQMQMLAALRSQRANIAAAEQNFRIDRRAIAGAIAWEMMEDPMTKWRGTMVDFLPARGMGWGQIHAWSLRNPFGDTMAKQAEDAGYLPKRTDEERKKILATPEGSITYIAGIMAAIADVPESMGFNEDIRSNPMMLTQVYHSWTLKEWKEKLYEKKKKLSDKEWMLAHPQILADPDAEAAYYVETVGVSESFDPESDMAVWVGKNLAFLEDAVGDPDLPESTRKCSTGPATRTVVVMKGSCLSDITQKEYGSPDLWPLIWDANCETIGSNPNLIHPGQKLSLAPLSGYIAAQIADAKRRAPLWKEFK